MNVCFVPQDFSGPGFYRCLHPADQLHLQGGHGVGTPEYELETLDSGFTLIKFNLAAIPDVETFVFHQPRDRHWPRLMRDLRSRGKAVIADADDYLISPPPWSGNFELAKRGGYKHLFRAFGQADLLTVSTPFLAEAYRRYQPNVKVLPNFLDWTMWENVEQQSDVDRGGRVRLGWRADAKWQAGDLAILSGVLGPLLERNPHVDLVLAGDSSGKGADLLGVPADRCIVIPRVDYHTRRLPEITATFDVNLVPLADHPFNEGKSHLRGLEAAACGIPSVVSATGPYQDAVEDGMRAFLCKRPNDWIRALELLVNDDALRRDLGRKSREYAAENTIQQHWRLWEQAYLGLLGGVTDEIARDAIKKGAIQKHGELEALVAEVAAMQPMVVVEIGSAKGGTFYAWCQSAAPGALLVSIDLPGGDFGGSQLAQVEETGVDGYGERDYQAIKGYGRPFQQVELIRADSQKPETRAALERLLAGRPIDFLMIDGDHAYEGVKRDFELYSPLVRDGGLIAFHDIVVHPKMPEAQVHRLWRELRPRHRNTELIDREFGGWGGIGVLHWERRGTSTQAAA